MRDTPEGKRGRLRVWLEPPMVCFVVESHPDSKANANVNEEDLDVQVKMLPLFVCLSM